MTIRLHTSATFIESCLVTNEASECRRTVEDLVDDGASLAAVSRARYRGTSHGKQPPVERSSYFPVSALPDDGMETMTTPQSSTVTRTDSGGCSEVETSASPVQVIRSSSRSPSTDISTAFTPSGSDSGSFSCSWSRCSESFRRQCDLTYVCYRPSTR